MVLFLMIMPQSPCAEALRPVPHDMLTRAKVRYGSAVHHNVDTLNQIGISAAVKSDAGLSEIGRQLDSALMD
jgi:hypothetical protein